MRIILGTVFALGVLLTLGAAMLTIDMLVTDDHRAAVSSSVSDFIDEQAEGPGEGERNFRRKRMWHRVFGGVKAVKDGILRKQELDLPAALPAAPKGWERMDYVTVHGEAITGAVMKRTPLTTTTTNGILLDFEKASGGKLLTARATYQNGNSMIALRMVGDMKEIRAVETGRSQPAKKQRAPFTRVDGVPVVQDPQVSHDVKTGKTVPVDYRHFTIDLEGMVEIVILTNAADEDVLNVLAGLDMQAIQAGLPRETDGYLEGAASLNPLQPEDGSSSGT